MRLLAISLYYLYELVILLFKVSEGNSLSLTFGCVVSVLKSNADAVFWCLEEFCLTVAHGSL
jgi:hypothetical protein